MMEEVGSGKFFDYIDLENDDVEDGLFGCGAFDLNSFPPVWFDDQNKLDLPATDRTARCNTAQLEWLSDDVQDPLSKVQTPPLCHEEHAPTKRKQKRKTRSLSDGLIYYQDKVPKKNVHDKCTHCEITDTPLLMKGPNGPHLLSNGCSILFKVGTLDPEYQPPLWYSTSQRKISKIGNQQPKKKQKVKILPFSGGFDGETDNHNNWPEYRPAATPASPTFDHLLHSSYHCITNNEDETVPKIDII